MSTPEPGRRPDPERGVVILLVVTVVLVIVLCAVAGAGLVVFLARAS